MHFGRHTRRRTFYNIQRQHRIVLKNGELNIKRHKLNQLTLNLVNVFIESRWRWTILYCILVSLLQLLLFAGIWWLILFLHGDLENDHLPGTRNSTEWKPCVKEIYNFTSIFLFSIEVQTSIGYGSRSITLECPEAIFTMCIESIAGKIIQSVIIGVVFAKLTRPKNRIQTLIFSKNVIINQRDGDLCMLFRIGNTRKSRIIASKVQAFLLRYVKDGIDKLENVQINLNLNVEDDNNILFIFPITAVHKIDKTSPFYKLSARELLKLELEILVTFEGTIESTGQYVQARSSYTTVEILWGRRFLETLYYKKQKRGFVIDYSKFDETYRVNTPLCNAEDLRKYYYDREMAYNRLK
ncbi:unnamed protein product [Leptidea sinapis]|uniref:Inward rectifier potassium channel C-terminal domain-containing protein n=1 Tax=Leptidea sinapis TaxID=189913 RepID=A0A5E4Q7Z0_9NEOP|nr:unnamed protein product [Leptidea sinapis]